MIINNNNVIIIIIIIVIIIIIYYFPSFALSLSLASSAGLRAGPGRRHAALGAGGPGPVDPQAATRYNVIHLIYCDIILYDSIISYNMI